jgi:hypothetical protein
MSVSMRKLATVLQAKLSSDARALSHFGTRSRCKDRRRPRPLSYNYELGLELALAGVGEQLKSTVQLRGGVRRNELGLRTNCRIRDSSEVCAALRLSVAWNATESLLTSLQPDGRSCCPTGAILQTRQPRNNGAARGSAP